MSTMLRSELPAGEPAPELLFGYVSVRFRGGVSAVSQQLLVSARVYAAVEDLVETEPLGELGLRGFVRPTPVFNVLGLKSYPPNPTSPVPPPPFGRGGRGQVTM